MRSLCTFVLIAAACYRPDYSEKTCTDNSGCPADYLCSGGHCTPGTRPPDLATPPDLSPPRLDLTGSTLPPRDEVLVMGVSAYTLGAAADAPTLDGFDQPQATVDIASFYLDVTEVTVAEYRACVQAGRCAAPDPTKNCDNAGLCARCNYDVAGRDDHPVNCVSQTEAAAFCAAVGRRLPTEDEFELVARGSTGRLYPWGTGQPGAAFICADRTALNPGTCPVTQYRGGFAGTPFKGIAGNVWEWTSSRACAYPNRNTGCKSATAWIVRGGGFSDLTVPVVNKAFLSTTRLWNDAAQRGDNRGFRCAHPAM